MCARILSATEERLGSCLGFLFLVLIAIILGIWQIYGQHSLDHCVSAIPSAPSWEMEMVRHVRTACKMPRAAVKKREINGIGNA